ncbi:MAG: GHKL domain-containing protein [Clostridiales bacterium]|nr:GHKL domain-containing protein [Clostridiales bacterium]
MIFYLSHFMGFLIQYGTAMAVCLLPYHEETFRFPRKKLIPGFCLMAVLFSVGFPLAMKFVERFSLEDLNMVANSYMMIAILLFCAGYFWLVQTETIKKWLVLVLAIIYAAAHYMAANMLCDLFDRAWHYEIYPPFTTAMYAASAIVLFPVMALIMRKIIRGYLDEMEVSYIRREFLLLLITSLTFLALMVGCYSLPDYLARRHWWLIMFAIPLVLVMFVLIYCLLFREAVWRKRESDQKKYAEIQSLQYSAITREMESFRRTRHDMRHYLGELSELLAQGKIEEMQTYLDELTGFTVRPGQTDYCKNKIINSLLQYYVGYASDDGIRFEIRVKCDSVTVPATDLTVIFGNILENAIRSCKQMEDASECLIRVWLDTFGTALVLEVTNPCAGVKLTERYNSRKRGLAPAASVSSHPDSDMQDSEKTIFLKNGSAEEFWPAEAYLSTKSSGGGIGLRSVAHTAAKYGGSARFRYDEAEKTFTSRIRLNDAVPANDK